MPIRVKCEKCKKTLSVKDHLAGKKIKCPVCQGVVAVPTASAASDPPPSAPAKGAPAKKPGSPTKPAAVKTKPKPGSNGAAPPTNGEKTNGKLPTPPPPPEPPPEHIEAEALSALADEPPPPEETQAPKTIDFKCQWCDEEVKLPIEMAGKQAQCPNPECKRIIKVPLPKAPQKKDWRKMERAGPAAAKISMPEALDNAWGTEEATRARQDSLAQAGAIETPPKPPRGVFGWLAIGFYTVCIVGCLLVVGFGSVRLMRSNEEFSAVKDIDMLLKGGDSKIDKPVLRAEAERTKGLYHLFGNDPKVFLALKDFQAALSYLRIEEIPDNEKPMLNEQLFLIDLALSQIDMGGSGDDLLGRGRAKRLEWEETRKAIDNTLRQIKSPAVQVWALRELAARLSQRAEPKIALPLAIGLAGGLSAETNGKRPPAFRQQIALIYADGKDLADIADEKELSAEELENGNLRVGFAEGYARKDKFEEAFNLANKKGPDEADRLDAFLGIAAVTRETNKEKSAEALKKALEIAKDSKNVPTPWQWLELARTAARLDDKDAAKEAIDRLKEFPPFQLRAHLEVFLALCDRSTTPVNPDALKDLIDAGDKEGDTLALAWMALARQHARTGASQKDNLKAFSMNVDSTLPPDAVERLRAMVIIGTYQKVR